MQKYTNTKNKSHQNKTTNCNNKQKRKTNIPKCKKQKQIEKQQTIMHKIPIT